jgi:hypothetical protein
LPESVEVAMPMQVASGAQTGSLAASSS